METKDENVSEGSTTDCEGDDALAAKAASAASENAATDTPVEPEAAPSQPLDDPVINETSNEKQGDENPQLLEDVLASVNKIVTGNPSETEQVEQASDVVPPEAETVTPVSATDDISETPAAPANEELEDAPENADSAPTQEVESLPPVVLPKEDDSKPDLLDLPAPTTQPSDSETAEQVNEPMKVDPTLPEDETLNTQAETKLNLDEAIKMEVDDVDNTNSEDSVNKSNVIGNIANKNETDDEKDVARKTLFEDFSSLEANALATLATAAATRAGPTMQLLNNTQNEESPKELGDKWYTVGIFERAPVVVDEYFDIADDYLGQITSTNLPDLASLAVDRFKLESNTAYKFRVAAVNTLGIGEWSEVAAFRTCTPGFPGAPCAIRISKRGKIIHISWDRPPENENILEYSVYLAVKKPDQRSPGFHFIRVYYGPLNQCDIPLSTLDQAQVDTVNERQSIIFRIAAKNEMGYGPATQVRWLQEKAMAAGSDK